MQDRKIYNCLPQARKRLNLTQAQLATQTNVSRQTIISIEKGHCVPSLEHALKISEVLNTPIEDLFSLEQGSSN